MAEAADGAPQLPEEIIIWEILTRLPAKPFVRCRAVCRSWRRRLTSDPKFLLAHHRRQPSLPLLTFADTQERRIDVMDHRTGERRPVARTDRTAADTPEDLDVLVSCDGLLIIVAYGGLYICNPATRERAPLPLLHVACISGLYPHRPSGTYRVLCCLKQAEDGHAVYHVHALGSGELRCVGEPPAPWASGDLVVAMPMMEFLQPHVLAGGRLYWHPLKLPGSGDDGKVNNMLVFDTVAETFRHMICPVDGPFIELFEMNGTLALYQYHRPGDGADLWLLQDQDRWVWSVKHQIKLQPTVFSVLPDPEGDLTVLASKGKTGLRWQYLQHISGADGSRSTRYEWSVFLRLRKLRFKESLVRHPFFSTEGDDDGGMDEKPLFDGLTTVAVLPDDDSRCIEESMMAKSVAS